jgi:hypothetical protein
MLEACIELGNEVRMPGRPRVRFGPVNFLA